MGFPKIVVAKLGTDAGALLVGTIFAAAGWLITHTVENVVSVPTVEYDIDDSKKDSGHVAVTLRNLSQDRKFSELEFILRLPEGGSGKFEKGAVEPIPPAYSARESSIIEDLAISYPAIGLHPGTSVRLTASYSGDTIPTFHIEPKGEGARLRTKGWLTWIISHEIEVLFGLLVAWTVTVILALGKLTGGGRNGALQKNGTRYPESQAHSVGGSAGGASGDSGESTEG